MSSAPVAAPKPEFAILTQPANSRMASVFLAGISVLLFFGPLAFGAVEPWSIFIMESGSGLLFLLWAIDQYRSGQLRIIANPLFRPMLGFGVLVFLQLALKHTANRVETLSAALLYVTYGMLCFLLVQSLRRTSQLRMLAIAATVYGGAVATFALLQSLTSNGKLYWLRTPRFGGWIYGPYVNHNHYAGFMEMLVPIPLVAALSRHTSRRHKIVASSVAAIMAITIFLSGSRGGMVAFAGQMGLLGALRLQHYARKPKLTWIAFSIAALGLLIWLGGADLAARLTTIPKEAKLELSGGTRLNIDRDGLRMFARKPLLGWGLGAFADVYPQFRSFPTNLLLDKAHNDYLQLLVETGALGFLVMLWFLVLIYRTAFDNLKRATDFANRELMLAAILGVTGILIHSFVDFNLQIPANAAWFYALCTIATVQVTSGGRKITSRRIFHEEVIT